MAEISERADREKQPVFAARALARVATDRSDEMTDVAVVLKDDLLAQLLERVSLVQDDGPVCSKTREDAACGAQLEFSEVRSFLSVGLVGGMSRLAIALPGMCRGRYRSAAVSSTPRRRSSLNPSIGNGDTDVPPVVGNWM